ncbi:YbdD/YjiX family protein [Pseudonocardia sp. DSM 110487]|uniref:YbdD/YjiX family protein n=1 Tax=Pseudonocardia sp. DSM 110487 TaxID=2865833 RepID=UPI001C6A369D|nr:YbdD/YjiX family protein [Pseudonocardia sp. DSM 110487]QYN35075.1 YbdD/YjiX family protein [Pseudonocardia sp. DSM 110487]
MTTLAEAWRGVHWYLRELTGETQYDRYVERHAREHPGAQPLSRREFERRRIDGQEPKPGSRCC